MRALEIVFFFPDADVMRTFLRDQHLWKEGRKAERKERRIEQSNHVAAPAVPCGAWPGALESMLSFSTILTGPAVGIPTTNNL